MYTKPSALSGRGKTLCLLFSFLLLALFNPFKSFGQAATDQASILKQCIDLPALQEFYPKNSEGVFEQVHIMQFPVSFEAGVSVSKFGQPVLFQSRMEVKTANPDVLLSFKTLSVKDQTAIAVFDFYYNRTAPAGSVTEVTVNLQRTENGWSITNSSLKN
jgi:hypothetical protein